jgi:predicted RNA binding protein YcfA (HicA-like mRNA interferase family)
MVTRDFSGREVASVLHSFGYEIVDRTGSHVKLKYTHPTNSDDIRVVTVPMHDRINTGTLQDIADQCNAHDFRSWCEWIDEHR